MDYEKLAGELITSIAKMQRGGPQQRINESMYGESFALNYLSLQQGDIQPSDISNTMGISAARITATLNSLEKKGLIERRRDPDDRRRILIELTAEGIETAKKRFESISKITCEMLSKLGEHDAREYVRITGKLAEIKKNCHE